jgi:hypothetical protein
MKVTSWFAAWHPQIVDADGPSWDGLRRQVAGGQFSPVGVEALGRAINTLERLLGASWPRRQYGRYGWWPAELSLLGFHVAVLPQFLALVTRLESTADEPTFMPVLRTIKRGVTTDGWRHALLQLEVARALRDPGTTITFEPEITGSAKRADLLVTRPDGSPFVVETTTLPRAQADLSREEHALHVWHAVVGLELRHGVRIAVRMRDYLDQAETTAWLDAIEQAACSLSAGAVQIVESAVGRAAVTHVNTRVQDPAFTGSRGHPRWLVSPRPCRAR